MNDSDLIKTLSDDLKPVKRLSKPWQRFLGWAAIYSLSLLLMMWAVEPFNFPTHLGLDTSLLLVSFLVTGVIAFSLLIPGFHISSLAYRLSFAPGVLFLGVSLYNAISPTIPETMNAGRIMCEVEIIIYSFMSLSIFLFFAKKSAPILIRRLSVMIAMSSTSFAVLLMQTACMKGALHSLLFHSPPLIICSVLSFFILPRFLRW